MESVGASQETLDAAARIESVVCGILPGSEVAGAVAPNRDGTGGAVDNGAARRDSPTDRNTTGPNRFDVPVVVVVWEGAAHLVDGRRRVNHWVKKRSMELHPVLIVEPSSLPKN
jgi:hypothetical protein